MNIVKLQADLGTYVPSKRRTDHAGTQMIVASLGIAKHDGKVFWNIVEDDNERMLGGEVLFFV
jgi:hypothetical protein